MPCMSFFRLFNCKAAGLFCFAFCMGIVAGLILPICAVATIEAILLLFIGYLCLFKW